VAGRALLSRAQDTHEQCREDHVDDHQLGETADARPFSGGLYQAVDDVVAGRR
jgi:hypothetical protein